MEKRRKIATGMAAGAVWAVAVLVGAATFVQLPVFALMPTIMTAFLAPGLVTIAMIGRLAQRRFFDDAIIDGEAFSGAAAIDQRVLSNTVEQLVLAMAVWPAAAVLLGGAVEVCHAACSCKWAIAEPAGSRWSGTTVSTNSPLLRQPLSVSVPPSLSTHPTVLCW